MSSLFPPLHTIILGSPGPALVALMHSILGQSKNCLMLSRPLCYWLCFPMGLPWHFQPKGSESALASAHPLLQCLCPLLLPALCLHARPLFSGLSVPELGCWCMPREIRGLYVLLAHTLPSFFLPCHRFSTVEPSGLLLYNGRLNERHDFLAVEIIQGQVQLKYSTGTLGPACCGICVMGAMRGPVLSGESECCPGWNLCYGKQG